MTSPDPTPPASHTGETLPAARRRRTILYSLVTLVVALLFLEGTARVGMWLLNSNRWEEDQRRLADRAASITDIGEIVHPYVGAVYDPDDHPDYTLGGKPAAYNRLGFSHATDPIQKRSPERYIIGVTGGSVAWQFACIAGDRLIENLHQIPELQDREIVLVCLALTGYKQPQQLMSVNYIMSLGGEFDLLINFDGFNEVAVAEWCYRRRISPAYPRAWPSKLPFGHDPTALTDRFQIWAVRAERQRLARDIRESWFRGSALRQLWWKSADQRLQRKETDISDLLANANLREELSYVRNGPPETFSSDADMYARFVDIWSNSSRAMHSLAIGSRFDYLHCLQPNQYDPGSKPLSEEEQHKAFNSDSEYKHSVEHGYPLLRAAGERLREEGVRFHDLSQMFRDHPETLYGDDCCHVYDYANALFADELARIVASELFHVNTR
ncbi:MAG: hypothetical protein KDA75_00690 [Planctomycetaceae bacterium]|nr:hypothetical protein [Planctomycetaceae bacterium]